MDARSEAVARVEAAIRDVLADEAKTVLLEIQAAAARAVVAVDGHVAAVLSYPRGPEDSPRLLEISWAKTDAAKTTDPLLRVVGKILANAGLLEAKICWGETGGLLDEIP